LNYWSNDIPKLPDLSLRSSRVIFLDFDGVLHPADYLRFIEVDGELVFGSDARFCWAGVLWDLIKDHDCGLVIHSSWRTSFALADIKDMLPPELASRVLGVTGGGARFRSIEAYVEAHRLREYLILDDEPEEFPLDLDALVVCHPERGIDSPEAKERVIQFLST
jgi:hypothetical protein